MEKENQEFNQHLIQLALGLQSTAWIALGKVANPHTGKIEINMDMARDSIDTLLMLKEKTKGNLNEMEKSFLENSMQDIELNYIEVIKQQETKEKKEETTKEPRKEEKATDKTQS